MKLSHIASRLFTLLLAVVLVGVFTFDAEARRLGGGKSMGRQSSNVTQRQATPPAAAPGNPSQSASTAGAAGAGTAAAGAAARKPWGAMVGGLAAGLGLAWLAHSLGLGPAFANFLLFMLLGVVILAVIGMIRRSRAGAQGQGLGRALLLHAFQVFKQRGEPYVDLKVLESNQRARQLYESAGMVFVLRAAVTED